jgi:murein DD-endopeptidase MepM/ murein hydrolase activator NlpD
MTIMKYRFHPSIRAGFNLLAAILLTVFAMLLWQRIKVPRINHSTAHAKINTENKLASSTEQGSVLVPTLDLNNTPNSRYEGISRRINPVTIIPTRPRDTVITYTVHLGDNLFSIAQNFNLKPETILWGNYDTLKDNPEILKIDQVLNILPVDGVYYQWQAGDSLENVASTLKVSPEAILNFSGNGLDLTSFYTNTSEIVPGTWLIVPGARRPLKDWGPPAISRSNPAVARYYGPGSCGSIYEGAVGSGVFIWPTTEHFISGYNFSSIHQAIDIGGQLGNPVYAADSGVVVYAGWSNFGYGNLLVIDHGNGWQTAYAHLSSIGVSCGQSVGRGTLIGALGSTGNSTGPHLHFEMSINGVKVNPLDYVQ